MLKNYFKTALRNIRRHKLYTFINVAGLAIGLAAFILIGLWIEDELSYDDFFQQADQIYRVATQQRSSDHTTAFATSPRPLARVIDDPFPEVIEATRLSRERADQVLVRYRDKHFFENRVFFADSNFFEVFSIPLLRGSPKEALSEPFSIVITEAAAQKYFGASNPLGKTLTLRLSEDQDIFDYVVTGVARGLPHNAHFHFDFLASYQQHPLVGSQDDQDNWLGLNLYTYVLLREGASSEALGRELSALAEGRANDPTEAEGRYEFLLQPLTSIHLHSDLRSEIEANGDIVYVYLFAAIALFILLLACINFVTLTTARAASRAKEVGLRKVLGSGRGQLVGRFLVESVLLSLLALFFAAGLIELVLPALDAFTGRPLDFDYFQSGWILPSFVGLALLVGIAAGSYPAVYLSSFRPAVVLKGGPAAASKGGFSLRSGLVVFQFAVAIALIVGTAVIYRQVSYMQSKKLGFDKEQVVVLEGTEDLGPQIEAFKEELLKHTGIARVTNAQTMPGRSFDRARIRLQETSEEGALSVAWLTAGYGFVETLGLDLVAGRSFSRASDSMAVILNESAVDALGLENPVGRELIENDRLYTVIGVIEDFHFASLHRRIGPLAIFGPDPWSQNRPNQLVAARIQSSDLSGVLSSIRKTWEAFVPEQPFAYSFLDERLDALYRSERGVGRLLGVFASLAVLIACLGLFGLSAYVAQHRTKEIGVRKVLGASVASIVALLSKDFLKLVLAAVVIASPVAYFLMNRWLEDFAYRIDIGLSVFVWTAVLAVVIAFLTVSYQSVKVALMDPVKSLRYE